MGWSLGLRMLPTDTFLSLTSASSAIEVRDLHHEVRLDMGIIFMYNVSIWGDSWGSGCGRRTRSPASASSVVEVRDLHPEVGLGMLINLVYNMST